MFCFQCHGAHRTGMKNSTCQRAYASLCGNLRIKMNPNQSFQKRVSQWCWSLDCSFILMKLMSCYSGVRASCVCRSFSSMAELASATNSEREWKVFERKTEWKHLWFTLVLYISNRCIGWIKSPYIAEVNTIIIYISEVPFFWSILGTNAWMQMILEFGSAWRNSMILPQFATWCEPCRSWARHFWPPVVCWPWNGWANISVPVLGPGSPFDWQWQSSLGTLCPGRLRENERPRLFEGERGNILSLKIIFRNVIMSFKDPRHNCIYID